MILSLFVIITHSYPLTGLPEEDWLHQLTSGQVSFSYLGVKGFFILSGYLIYQSQTRSKNIVEYYWKRFVRLFPALIVVLIITVILGPFVYKYSLIDYLKDKTVWTYIPNNLTLYRIQPAINGIFENLPYPFVINGSIWTIAYEFFCYVLISLLFFVKKKNTAIIAITFLVFVISKLFFFDVLGKYRFMLFSNHIIELSTFFFAGALLAVLKIENFKYKNILLIASVILLIFSLIFGFFRPIHYFVMPVAIILFGISSTPVINAIGKTIGDLSYGIYIYAFPIQQTLVYYFHLNYLQLMLYATLITLVFGFLSWHLIEKHALKLKKLPLKSTLFKKA